MSNMQSLLLWQWLGTLAVAFVSIIWALSAYLLRKRIQELVQIPLALPAKCHALLGHSGMLGVILRMLHL